MQQHTPENTINIKIAFICFFALSLLIPLSINSQSAQPKWPKGLSIESSIHFGQIIKHTPKLTFEVPSLSPGVDLNFKFQTWGKRPWQELQGYPLLGISFSYFQFGEPDLLGNAVSFVPNLTVFITKKKWFDAHFLVGTGLAFLSQKYDIVENPEYNAIGSNINNTVVFKLGMGFKVTKHFRIVTDGAFTHFSNGSASLPNFGVNIPAISLGVNYIPHPLKAEDYVLHNESKKGKKKLGLSMHLGMAFTESQIAGGPKYPFYISSLAGNFYLNKINRLHLGMAFEFDRAVYDFGRHVFAFENDDEGLKRARRLSVFVGDEFLFGQWGLLLEAGYYLSQNAYLLPLPYYTKLSTRYFLPPIGKPKTKFFLTLMLKSHLFNAEYIGLGLGAVL